MKTIKKSDTRYKTIGEVAKELNLIDFKSGKLKTHTIRFWETQFKEIKPSVRAGKRRYYSEKDFKIIKTIHYLLKKQGMTIKGVQGFLSKSKDTINYLDGDILFNVNKQSIDADGVKKKLSKINNLFKDLKNG